MAQNLKTGDNVKVIAGDHKGETGRIVKMDRENQKAFVEGIGMRERHYAKSMVRPNGGKADIHVGIHVSNLKKEEGKK